MIALPHRPGAGWLVLIGGASGHWTTTEPIDHAAIAAIRRDGPIAFLPAAGYEPDYGTSFLTHYQRLGAPEGYVVPVQDAASARDPESARLLASASLIYIGGGDTRQLLDIMAGSLALEAMAQAFAAGAVIAGASAGAIALAAAGVPLDPGVAVFAGWGWLPGVIVSPHHTPDRARRLRDALDARPGHAGVGLPDDAALAVGPAGEHAHWGAAGIEIIAPS